MQTVEGDGFSVQIPADWTVFRGSAGFAVSSPIDFSKQAPPVQLNFAIIPAPPPLVPAEMAATMIDTNKLSPTVVESESQVTLGGKAGTRLETTNTNRVNETSDETSKTAQPVLLRSAGCGHSDRAGLRNRRVRRAGSSSIGRCRGLVDLQVIPGDHCAHHGPGSMSGGRLV